MTQAEALKIEKEVSEGLRILGLDSEHLVLIPQLPSELPAPRHKTTEYRTLIGNSTDR